VAASLVVAVAVDGPARLDVVASPPADERPPDGSRTTAVAIASAIRPTKTVMAGRRML
jgi:hypothetical protein